MRVRRCVICDRPCLLAAPCGPCGRARCRRLAEDGGRRVAYVRPPLADRYSHGTPGHEERLALYAARAALELPLFEGAP